MRRGREEQRVGVCMDRCVLNSSKANDNILKTKQNRGVRVFFFFFTSIYIWTFLYVCLRLQVRECEVVFLPHTHKATVHCSTSLNLTILQTNIK